jgi:glucose-1-phosphate adenylyltransferase
LGAIKLKKTLALIVAGGRLDLFSNYRSKAAMPFAGKYRLIDFSLSNCVNSGIENIGIITQYMPYSLKRHIGIGKPWDLDRKNGGITILQPHKGAPGSGWYQGDGEAIYKNISYLKNQKIDDVLVLPGNLVYKMDYQKLLKVHREKNADLTIAANNIPYDDACHFSIINYDQEHRVNEFQKETDQPAKNLVSMGVNVFKAEVLLKYLSRYCSQGAVTLEEDIIPEMIADKLDVFLYDYDGYWKNIRTVDSYWKSNLETAENIPRLDLYDEKWKIHTRSEEKPPAKFGKSSHVNKCLISNGAIINGRVENSIISPGVYIEEGALVTDSVILNNCVIRQNALINKSIMDKNVLIGANCLIGSGNDFSPNTAANNILNSGLNIIAKNIKIAENTLINRNCRIEADVNNGDFKNNEIKSGSTVN